MARLQEPWGPAGVGLKDCWKSFRSQSVGGAEGLWEILHPTGPEKVDALQCLAGVFRQDVPRRP